MRRAMARWIVAAALLSGITGAQAAPYRVVGYVVDGPQAPVISPGKLDVVNFAFAQVDTSHHVFLPGTTAPDNLRALVALRARQPSLRIVLSIGGWGAGHFSEAAADASSRAAFADSAIALLRRYDLDGLDIDWEYPTLPGPGISHDPSDKRNFTLLLELLRQRLDSEGQARDGRHYLLTIAAAEGEFAQGLELARIARSLDWINLMTYDFYGSLTPTTGHHAGLAPTAGAPAGARNAQAAVDEYLAAGVPADKVHLGVAFYGRRFGDVNAARDGLLQKFGSDGGFISWREIAEGPLKQKAWTRHWDAQAKAPWLWNATTHQFISYDDPQSLRAKIDYVEQRGLGGIMYWEYRQDLDEQLLDVLVQGRAPRP
jgi:chitinase